MKLRKRKPSALPPKRRSKRLREVQHRQEQDEDEEEVEVEEEDDDDDEDDVELVGSSSSAAAAAAMAAGLAALDELDVDAATRSLASSWLAFPKPILCYILAFLEPSALCQVESTCRYLRQVAASDAVWKPHAFGIAAPSPLDPRVVLAPQAGRAARGSLKKLFASRVGRWLSAAFSSSVNLQGHTRPVRCVTYDPRADGLAITGARDKTLRVWHLGSNSCVASATTGSSVNAVSRVTGAPDLVLSGNAGPVRTANLWRLGEAGATFELTPLCEFSGHVDSVFACAANAAVSRVVTGGGQNDCRALVYDLETTQLLDELPTAGSVRDVRIFNGAVWTASLDKSLRCYDLRAGLEQVHTVCAHKAGLHGVHLHGHYVATCCGRPENAASLWDVRRLDSAVARFTDHSSAVSTIQFDDFKLLTGSYDGEVHIYSAKSHEHTGSLLPGNGGKIQKLCFEHATLLVATDDAVVTEFDFSQVQ